MAGMQTVRIVGDLDRRVLEALAKCLPDLVLEAELTYFTYDPEADVFFFTSAERQQKKDWNAGYCLSVADAEQGAWKTIHEPATF